jgi:predicted oxidoreductase (fatty acid repression mutant protein)
MNKDQKKARRLAKQAIDILETKINGKPTATFHNQKHGIQILAGAFDELWQVAKQEAKKVIDEKFAAIIFSANALANKVDKHSECDHKRVSCEAIGCVGHEVRILRDAIKVFKNFT